MIGYLLDTNTVRHWHSQHPNVVTRISALPDETIVQVSAITLGELECGHNLFVRNRDLNKRDEFIKFVEVQFPVGRILPVSRHTREYYGTIRAALIEKYAPDRKSRSKNPEQWYDPVLASQLLIGENDLWIASQALERNLTLVTNDKMTRIKDTIKDSCGKPLACEDWVR